jgi:PTS system nitrogen regulatory IIA component
MRMPPADAMTIADLLAPADVVHGLRVGNKKALLRELARLSSQTLGLYLDDVLAALARREDLGSTGVGDGVALPHARMEAIRRPFGLLVRLREPVNYEAVDDRPVDLVFLLLLPASAQSDHLNALACASRRLRDPETAAALRGARDAAALYSLITDRTLSKA